MTILAEPLLDIPWTCPLPLLRASCSIPLARYLLSTYLQPTRCLSSYGDHPFSPPIRAPRPRPKPMAHGAKQPPGRRARARAAARESATLFSALHRGRVAGPGGGCSSHVCRPFVVRGPVNAVLTDCAAKRSWRIGRLSGL
jgi:hypothetical protein